MKDLVARVLLKADGSGLVGQVRSSKAAMAELGAEAKATGAAMASATAPTTQAAAAVTALGGAARQTGSAVDAVAGGMRPAAVAAEAMGNAMGAAVGKSVQLSAAETRLAAATATLAAAQDKAGKAADGDAAAQTRAAAAVANAHARVAAAQAGLEKAQNAGSKSANDNEKALTRQAFGLRNAGQQVGDFGLQIASGAKPAQAFANQIGQLGYALSEMGGIAGKVGGFLTGPWGIALTVGLAVLAPFVEKLFEGSTAADAQGKSTKTLAEAISDLDNATGRSNQTHQQAINLAAVDVATKYRQALSTRELTRRTLELAKARLTAAAAENAGQISPEGGINIAGVAEVAAARQVKALDKQIADQTKKIGEATASIRGIAADRVLRGVVAETDKAAGATARYEERVGSLRRQFEKGEISAGTLRIEAQRATAARDAVLGADRAARTARTAQSKALREQAKETRDAETANRKLEESYNRLAQRLDSTTDALRDYAKELREIAALLSAGKIDQGQSFLLRGQAEEARDKALDVASRKNLSDDFQLGGAFEKPLSDFVRGDLADGLIAAGRRGAQAFGDAGTASVERIAAGLSGAIGGKVGGALGGLASLLKPDNRSPVQKALGSDFRQGADAVLGNLKSSLTGITKKLGDVFGLAGGTGAFEKTLGKLAGYGQIGQATSRIVGGSKAGGSLGGVLGGAAAEELLTKTLGSFAGPLGSIAGSVLGSVAGKLLTSTKSGSVTLTSATGALSATGNDGASKKAATGLAGNIQNQLQSIAEQLGGQLGAFNVTVGQRHGDYRVTTGTSLKVKKGAKDFDDDADAAASYALQLAISQGAVKGLSAALQKAISSSPDVNKALAEALKVQEVETLIAGVGSELSKTFKTFETAATDRVRIAKQYGLDLVKVEEKNAKERADIFEQVISDRTASLKSLMEDLAVGDLFEGNAVDKRKALLDAIGTVQKDAEGGVDGAADKLASLSRELLSSTKASFGTGAEYATDLANTQATITRVVQMENDRAKAAQDEARGLRTATEKGNEIASEAVRLADESNDQATQMNAKLDGILVALAGSKTGAYPANLAAVARTAFQ